MLLLNGAIEAKLVSMILSKYLCRILSNTRPHHFKLLDYLHRFSDIQRERLERLIDENLALLRDLILRYRVQISKAFVQESSDVLQLLEDNTVELQEATAAAILFLSVCRGGKLASGERCEVDPR